MCKLAPLRSIYTSAVRPRKSITFAIRFHEQKT